MPHCILFRPGSEKISEIIYDCVKKKGSHPHGWDYLGSNCRLMGIKPWHYAEKWTNDPVDPCGLVSQVVDAPRFGGLAMSSREDVNARVREKIREVYSQEDEFKLQRRKLGGHSDERAWQAYCLFVEALCKEARNFKDIYFPKE